MKRIRAISIIKKAFLALVFMMLLIIPVGFGEIYATETGKTSFQIDFIDVGQGDSTLIQCDGHYMLVDGGDTKQSSRIYSILMNRSIHHLDVMVATHPEEDHIGGLSGALNYATVSMAYSPVMEHDAKAFQSLVKNLNKQGTSITVPKVGDTFKIGSATATVLGPKTISSESNNNSIVLRIVYGNTSFLLTGDAETDEENFIMNSGQTVKSTVLKIAHHGSNSSSGYRFIREVAPQYAVISVGSDNQYGHPAENVLNRLRDADVKTYRTDMQGDISCTSDGKTVRFSVKRNAGVDTLAIAGSGKKSEVQNIESYAGGDTNNVTRSVGTAGDSQTENTETNQTETSYVLNTNTHRFHYPSCKSVSQMKDKNKSYYTGSRDEVISQGYVPCNNCNP